MYFANESRYSGNGSDQIKEVNIVSTALLYYFECYLKFGKYDKPSSLGKAYYFCSSIELFYVTVSLEHS